jgi:hypothetical protein
MPASFIILLFLPAFQLQAQVAPERALVNKYCVACHNTKLKTGGLALDALSGQPVTAHTESWEKVVRRLRARQMPPIGMPRPDGNAYQSALASLESALDKHAAANPNPGRTDTFRRLTRTEYKNAIRDLVALDIDSAALLPADEASHGFDNVTVGDLSPTLLDRYVSAAEKISRLALGRTGKSPGGETFRVPPDLTQEDHIEGLPIGTRGGALVRYTFPASAEYEIQLRLARDRNEHVEGLFANHELELLIDGNPAQTFTVRPPGSQGEHATADLHLMIRLPVTAGPHSVGAAFLKSATTLLESERKPPMARFNFHRHPRTRPAIYSISITGPFHAAGPGETESRKRILVCPQQSQECASKILGALARRAWRRPVNSTDIAKPLLFFNEASATGGFDAGLELAITAILVSPEFLFRVAADPEGTAPNAAYRVSDLELASRLSFFLWSSIPDEPLLAAAEMNHLRDPAVLNAQVRRMLADPRSSALVTNFASQWLHLRNLDSAFPDMRLYPDFDDNLRQAFRTETELFFDSIIREDRNVVELLKADYSFLNERLAKHYNIPHIYGTHFRRANLPPGSNRGGLLRHGSILTVTSYATRTSPVLRGKWVLDNFLGIPPPPPPGNVGDLKDNVLGKNLSVRERLTQHRDNPACSGCHQLMDPIGFALENYDAVGRWRTHENARAVDSTGATLDGAAFQGVNGLETALLARPELFAGVMTEKLMTYALGRGVEHFDQPAIRRILAAARPGNYRFSSLILGIVNSIPFQMRRSR